MSETAKFWGAHAPRVLRLAPSPIAPLQRQGFRRGRREMHARARALPNPP
jgi:hypothetical protein